MTEKPTHVTINFFIFAQGGPEPDPGLLQRWGKLTPREQEVALLAARNLTNAQIAGKLFIAPDTAKSHVRSVIKKLDLSRKGDLIWALVSNGLAEGDPDVYRGA